MTSYNLRKIRIVLSVLTLLLFISVFIDFRNLLPDWFIKNIVFFQFIPSAYKFHNIGILAATGLFVVLMLTLISGRIYCSFLCPLGALQDIFIRIGNRIKNKRRRFTFSKPHNLLRYSLLVLLLITTFLWGIYFLTLLDPYSIFGRLITYFGKPFAIALNNVLSEIMVKFNIYSFVKTPLTGFPLLVYLIPLTFFILIGLMSFIKGRLYCNTICPVGTFLGLISKISLFRIIIDNNKCTGCGRCSWSCKSSCIDFHNMNVDITRCVNCFNCLGSCPADALSFSIVKTGKSLKETDNGRRKFITGSVLLLLGVSGSSTGKNRYAMDNVKSTSIKEYRKYPVCPPGSTGIEYFTNRCTACSLCVSVCPNNVLIPSLNEYGLSGLMQPRLDFHKGFCAYECVKCLEICPTGALMPMAIESKKLTQLGKAVFIMENCVVVTEKTSCGACSESCPTKAVQMVHYEGKLVIPKTQDEICIGCGHCEFACPTTPYKAIFVDGNFKHQTAKKPEKVKSELNKPVEFPF
jgi:polyferredoxin